MAINTHRVSVFDHVSRKQMGQIISNIPIEHVFKMYLVLYHQPMAPAARTHKTRQKNCHAMLTCCNTKLGLASYICSESYGNMYGLLPDLSEKYTCVHERGHDISRMCACIAL